ncbi:MAG: MOSC domain-containing protein [Planctomycetota bacterium]|nr:MAG: MOSC domain-containing protein [Planctomycetota bacterium]
MNTIGTVASLWRYPVKSMRGEELNEAFVGFSGIYGDRVFAFRSSAGPKGFPYLTAREQRKLLQYRPRFRYPDKAARPINLAEAESMGPGVNPVSADPADLLLDVQAPTGQTVAIDDPELLRMLGVGVSGGPELTLVRSDRAMTDCRPVSLFSMQSARQLGEEIGIPVDQRRFRANIYLDLGAVGGFAENGLIGRSVRIGAKVVISILERDPRCVMITLDPETGESKPEFLRQVAQAHEGMAGVYGAVLVEGMLGKGDAVQVLG